MAQNGVKKGLQKGLQKGPQKGSQEAQIWPFWRPFLSRVSRGLGTYGLKRPKHAQNGSKGGPRRASEGVQNGPKTGHSGTPGSQGDSSWIADLAQNPSKTAYKWLVTVLGHFSPRNAPERGPKMAPFLETPFPIKSGVQNGPF